MSNPTTGDPRADKLVEIHFAEAIDVIRQILVDRHPELIKSDQGALGQTCALIAVQTWPIFGALFTEGASILAGGEAFQLGDDDGDSDDNGGTQ